MDISFADVDITELFKVRDIKRSILPPRKNYGVEVPGRHGAYYAGYKYEPRIISIDIIVISSDLNLVFRQLAWMLDLPEPSKLIISDEPDKCYYAVIDGETNVNTILKYGEGTINFICFDPFAYSTAEKPFSFNAAGKCIINNQGTAPTAPRFEIDFTDDCGYVAIVSSQGVIQIGNPKEIDGVPLPKSERLVNHTMENTTGLTINDGKVRTAGAKIQGTVKSVGNPVYGQAPNSWGTTPADGSWHGMTMKKVLPVTADTTSSAQYWQAEMVFNFKSDDGINNTLDGKQIGRIELNVLDEANNFLAGFTMRDSYGGYEYNIPEFFVGTKQVYTDTPAIPAPKKVKQYNTKTKKWEYKTVNPTHVGAWNDFYGKILIRKSGNQFYFELQKIEPGTWKVLKKISKTYYDTANEFGSKKAKAICTWFGKAGTNPAMGNISCTNLFFRKDNVENYADLPNLFGAGDRLIIDCNTSQVYLNESLFMDRLDIGSTFFEVLEGETEVRFYDSTFSARPTVVAKITEKFL